MFTTPPHTPSWRPNQYKNDILDAEKKETAAILLSMSQGITSEDHFEYDQDYENDHMITSPTLRPQKTFYIPKVSIMEECNEAGTFPSINSSCHPLNRSVSSPLSSPPLSPSQSSVPSLSSSSSRIPFNVCSPPPSPPIRIDEAASQDAVSSALPVPWVPKYCKYQNCLVCQRGPPTLVIKNPTWSTIMRVVFYTLSQSHPDRQFFNLRTDVYMWMDEHWKILCESSKERENNWRKQVQDMLSHSKNLFESGTDHFKQNGFWRLKPSIDIDPWTIKKPYRDKSKIPLKSKRSLSESDLFKMKKPKTNQKELSNSEIKEYILANDIQIKIEVEKLNEEMKNIQQMIMNLNTGISSSSPGSSLSKSVSMELPTTTTTTTTSSKTHSKPPKQPKSKQSKRQQSDNDSQPSHQKGAQALPFIMNSNPICEYKNYPNVMAQEPPQPNNGKLADLKYHLSHITE